jgi:hypothetical protein
MAFYIINAKPKPNVLELREQIDSGELAQLEPFGETLSCSLRDSRIDRHDRMVWVEEDYCNPPLRMEREAVLDKYFEDIQVEKVQSEEEGWKRISDLPVCWFLV